MAKRVRRARRPPRTPSRTSALERILDAPQLARIVPQLQPEVLHRVIQHYGLEDCGPLVALATPDQLARVFDLDLWRPAAPGLDEQFDADRFGAWLEVLVDANVSGAAATLAGMDADLVAGALAQHVRVFNAAAVGQFITLDGEVASPGYFLDDRVRYEVGGFVVVEIRTRFSEAITMVLTALADAHADRFSRIMRTCCHLSSSRPEVDRLDDLLTTREQAMFDMALDREMRRDVQGYVTPAQARAFLQASRGLDLRQGVPPPRDPITDAYFKGLAARTSHGQDEENEPPPRDLADSARDCSPEEVAAIVDLLNDLSAVASAKAEGVMPRAPRALLEGSQTTAPRLLRVRTQLQFARDHAPDAYAMRTAELAYLSNVVIAGSTIQSRSLTADDASNAVVAVCNLGVENWPAPVAEDLLIGHDLVSVFQVGWTVLHEDVCMYAAEQLLGALKSIQSTDAHLNEALETLRITLIKHWRAGSPWNARDALDTIAILDTPSWAALLGFIDQFPTMHAAVGASLSGTTARIEASAFEFISENAQIQQVRAFMEILPRRLQD